MLVKLLRIVKNIDSKFKPYLLVSIFGAFFLSSVGNPSFPLILTFALLGKLNRVNENTVTS